MTVTPPVAPGDSRLPSGLDPGEATRRLKEHGPNEIPAAPPPPLWRIFARQFRSPLVYILLAALAIETVTWVLARSEGWPLEIIAIAVTLALNALLGTLQEHRTEAAIARLSDLAAPRAWVLRGGRAQHVPAREIVPGDVLRLEAGDRVPADATLLESGLALDESLLTGESLPVERGPGDEIHGGTLVVRGHAHALTVRTGRSSALGEIAHLLSALELGRTPLERRLDKMGRQIFVLTLALSALFVLVAVAVEGPSHIPAVLLLAVALAVAAVPEELPAVLTLTLALGVERMAKRNALVRRLSAVEALGSVTVIATDKTGTLTENRLSVRHAEFATEQDALAAMILANDGDPGSRMGDPLDLALLDFAKARGADLEAIRASNPRISETPFDSAWKYMRASVRAGASLRSYVKGAPEAVLARVRDAEVRNAWQARAEALAREGNRVLALATREGEGDDDLTFAGLVGLWDSPRAEVPEAIAKARSAGVRVLMITGDHPDTALAVARSVGLEAPRAMTGETFERLSIEEQRAAAREIDVFARVKPRHKFDIVDRLKQDGQIVAVTGDGVNDAPALRRADVGVAMGLRGSDVAREAASIVLMDDDFATIVDAIEEGRSLYENIQKFIRFMFSTSLSFLVLVLVGAAGSLALGLRTPSGEILLPLTALQILWINFLADGPPAFALGLDKTPAVLSRPPRNPKTPLLDLPSKRFILASAGVKAAIGLLMLVVLPVFGYSVGETQAAVFAYEFLAQLAFADPSRRVGPAPQANRVLQWTLAASVLVLASLYAIGPLRDALGLTVLDASLVLAVLASVAFTFLTGRGVARWSGRAHSRSTASA